MHKQKKPVINVGKRNKKAAEKLNYYINKTGLKYPEVLEKDEHVIEIAKIIRKELPIHVRILMNENTFIEFFKNNKEMFATHFDK